MFSIEPNQASATQVGLGQPPASPSGPFALLRSGVLLAVHSLSLRLRRGLWGGLASLSARLGLWLLVIPIPCPLGLIWFLFALLLHLLLPSTFGLGDVLLQNLVLDLASQEICTWTLDVVLDLVDLLLEPECCSMDWNIYWLFQITFVHDWSFVYIYIYVGKHLYIYITLSGFTAIYVLCFPPLLVFPAHSKYMYRIGWHFMPLVLSYLVAVETT